MRDFFEQLRALVGDNRLEDVLKRLYEFAEASGSRFLSEIVLQQSQFTALEAQSRQALLGDGGLAQRQLSAAVIHLIDAMAKDDEMRKRAGELHNRTLEAARDKFLAGQYPAALALATRAAQYGETEAWQELDRRIRAALLQRGDTAPVRQQKLRWPLLASGGLLLLTLGIWTFFRLAEIRNQPTPNNCYSYPEGLGQSLNLMVDNCGDTPLYGFAGPDGKARIAAEFDKAGAFQQGAAPVAVSGRWGWIDSMGRELIPVQFDSTALRGDSVWCWLNGSLTRYALP